MAAPPGTPPGMNPEEIRQMWETGSRSLLEGFRQAQEFWNNTARSIGRGGGRVDGPAPALRPWGLPPRGRRRS